MTVAVSMAKHLGATKLAVPSAGNAGGALAAYAARAGLEAHIFMPRDTPRANIIECRELGAHVTLIDGLITDCGAEIARRKTNEGWFDMSTLKEPYRVEGKKTLGYELAEQLGLAITRCHSLSNRRRHRAHWNVESVRRNGGARLDRQKTSAHVRGASGRLCANRPRVRSRRKKRHRNFQCAHDRLWAACSKGDWRFPDPEYSSQSDGGAIAVEDKEMIRVGHEVGSSEGLFVAPKLPPALLL